MEHSEKYGPECQSEHHTRLCDYSHREHGACTHYSNSPPPPPNPQEKSLFHQNASVGLTPGQVEGEMNQDIAKDNKELDTMIRMFPTQDSLS